MANEKNSTNTFLLLTAGIVAGAALGVMFAPAKGSETRQKIKDGASRLANRIKNLKEESYEDEFEIYKDEEVVS